MSPKLFSHTEIFKRLPSLFIKTARKCLPKHEFGIIWRKNLQHSTPNYSCTSFNFKYQCFWLRSDTLQYRCQNWILNISLNIEFCKHIVKCSDQSVCEMGGMAGKADLGPWGAIGGSLRWHRLPDCMRRRAGSPNLKWIASPCYFQLTLIVTKANAHTTTTTAPHDHVCETIETLARHLWYRKISFRYRWKYKNKSECDISVSKFLGFKTFPIFWMLSNSV